MVSLVLRQHRPRTKTKLERLKNSKTQQRPSLTEPEPRVVDLAHVRQRSPHQFPAVLCHGRPARDPREGVEAQARDPGAADDGSGKAGGGRGLRRDGGGRRGGGGGDVEDAAAGLGHVFCFSFVGAVAALPAGRNAPGGGPQPAGSDGLGDGGQTRRAARSEGAGFWGPAQWVDKSFRCRRRRYARRMQGRASRWR